MSRLKSINSIDFACSAMHSKFIVNLDLFMLHILVQFLSSTTVKFKSCHNIFIKTWLSSMTSTHVTWKSWDQWIKKFYKSYSWNHMGIVQCLFYIMSWKWSLMQFTTDHAICLHINTKYKEMLYVKQNNFSEKSFPF